MNNKLFLQIVLLIIVAALVMVTVKGLAYKVCRGKSLSCCAGR